MARHLPDRWSRTAARLVTALLAVTLAACSAAPQSLVTESSGPGSASAAPASASPGGPSPSVEGATPTAGAGQATPKPRIPDKPARVKLKTLSTEAVEGGAVKVVSRITWSAPEGVATSFSVVGVTECLRDAAKYDGKPCLVKGMRIPRDVQEVLAVVPGGERSVEVAWKAPEIGPGPYYAILVRASNDAGDSIFTIAWSDTVCRRCTY